LADQKSLLCLSTVFACERKRSTPPKAAVIGDLVADRGGVGGWSRQITHSHHHDGAKDDINLFIKVHYADAGNVKLLQ
jgi:hypothetical protein